MTVPIVLSSGEQYAVNIPSVIGSVPTFKQMLVPLMNGVSSWGAWRLANDVKDDDKKHAVS